MKKHLYLTEDTPDGGFYHFIPDSLTKEGNIDRDSAIQWLKDRTGNHIKLKDLCNYRIPHGIHKIGFYEFAKLSNWIGDEIDIDEVLKIKPQ